MTAGAIVFNQAMNIDDGSFVATGLISNAGSPVDIVAVNTVFFNSLANNVGSVLNPILVHTTGELIADSSYLAAFDDSALGDTVQAYAPNPPCVIYFNGVKIADCGAPPPPPPPGPPAPTPKRGISKGVSLFAVIGVYDSQFNLASDYYFLTYFFDERYWRRAIPIFYRTSTLIPISVDLNNVGMTR